MFELNDDQSIYATRGDVVYFAVEAKDRVTGETFAFLPGDSLRIKIYGKKDAENVYLQKEFLVYEECTEVAIYLDEEDTKIGEVISKPVDYWYEIELNPDTDPKTIIGYDDDGPKIFKLFPEGADIPEYIPDENDIPFVDSDLDISSPRPVANRVVTQHIMELFGLIEDLQHQIAGLTTTDSVEGVT